MFPIVPILAWVGGVTAGAQVLQGVVKGAGELVRCRPGSAITEVANGCMAPVNSALYEMSRLGFESYSALTKPWRQPVVEVEEAEDLEEPTTIKRQRRQRKQDTEFSKDGVLAATEG